MSEPASPNVTVVCCTHNRVQFVRRHYAMLRDRLTSACEILYALDHCTDDTLAFVQGIAAVDPRVRFAANDGPAGLFSCRNFGIAQARGRYIHYLDDDDAVSDGFYAAIDAAIAAGLEGEMLLTDLVLDEEGHAPRHLTIVDRQHVATHTEGPATIIEGDLFDHILHGRLYFYNGNTLIRRNLLQRHPFRAEIRKTADWLLYLEVSHLQPIRQVYLPGVHAIYCVHGASMSIAPDKVYWSMKAFEALYGLVPRDHAHAPATRRAYARALFDAGYAARLKNKHAAMGYYWQSARLGRPLKAMLAVAKLALV